MSALRPMSVVLVPHDPQWARRATLEAERLHEALSSCLVDVHHIGSTAIPNIDAKPIIDLMPVVAELDQVDQARAALATLGFQSHGEFGIEGRRFCTWSNPDNGLREIYVHIFRVGSEHITRHLAFRDFMRAHPDEARAYEAEKRRCRDLHPDDSRAYSEAKSPWIAAAQARAMIWFAATHG